MLTTSGLGFNLLVCKRGFMLTTFSSGFNFRGVHVDHFRGRVQRPGGFMLTTLEVGFNEITPPPPLVVGPGHIGQHSRGEGGPTLGGPCWPAQDPFVWGKNQMSKLGGRQNFAKIAKMRKKTLK